MIHKYNLVNYKQEKKHSPSWRTEFYGLLITVTPICFHATLHGDKLVSACIFCMLLLVGVDRLPVYRGVWKSTDGSWLDHLSYASTLNKPQGNLNINRHFLY